MVARISGMQPQPRLLLHTMLPPLLLWPCLLHEQGCCRQAEKGPVRLPPRTPLPASRHEAPQTEACRQQQREGLLVAFRAASCKL